MAEVNEFAWGSDESADWFHRFWQGNNIALVIDTIENFDVITEEFDSFRSACHVLACFGSSYAFPVELLHIRGPTIQNAITILEKMLNPPSDDWNFLENWGNNEKVIASVTQQINDLTFVLSQ